MADDGIDQSVIDNLTPDRTAEAATTEQTTEPSTEQTTGQAAGQAAGGDDASKTGGETQAGETGSAEVERLRAENERERKAREAAEATIKEKDEASRFLLERGSDASAEELSDAMRKIGYDEESIRAVVKEVGGGQKGDTVNENDAVEELKKSVDERLKGVEERTNEVRLQEVKEEARRQEDEFFRDPTVLDYIRWREERAPEGKREDEKKAATDRVNEELDVRFQSEVRKVAREAGVSNSSDLTPEHIRQVYNRLKVSIPKALNSAIGDPPSLGRVPETESAMHTLAASDVADPRKQTKRGDVGKDPKSASQAVIDAAKHAYRVDNARRQTKGSNA